MSTLLKKQIAYTELHQHTSLLMKLWLLVLHIVLGAYQVLTMLFMSPMSSFQEVHDLTDSGYKVSYLDHCRLQHNVRFGTLAYSLVLVMAITLVRTSIEIIYPDKFNQAAYASNLLVNKAADTNDGVCDADCSLREAIAVAANGDTILFDGGLTGQAIVLTGGQITINQSNLIIDGSNRNITIDGNNSVPVCIRINTTANNTQLTNFNMRRCTTTMVSMEATGSLLKNMTLTEVGTTGVVLNANSTMVDTVNITGTGIVTNNCISIANNRSSTTVKNSEIQACKTAIGGGTNVQQATVDGNYIVAASTNLFNFANSNNITVTNNRFGQKRNLTGGACGSTVKFTAVNTITFSSNTYTGCTSTLLDITGGTAVTINNNTFNGPNVPGLASVSGVKITSGGQIRIYGNTFSNATSPSGYALMLINNPNDVVIGKNSDNSLAANTFSNNSAGISATGSVVLIKGNNFTANAKDIEGTGLSESFIQDNSFNSPTIGVLIHSSQSPWIFNNNFSGLYSDKPLVIDTQTANAKITGNQFKNVTGDDAIHVKDSSSCTISANTVVMQSVGETQAAVGLSNVDGCQLDSNDLSVPGGYGVVLNEDSDNNVIGCSADINDATGFNGFNNTQNNGLADVALFTSQANGNVVRCNHSTASGANRLVLLDGAVDVTPAGSIINTHTTKEITGTTASGTIVDIYGDDNWLKGVQADSTGNWSFTPDVGQGDLTQFDQMIIAYTTAAGTSVFSSYAQPTGDVAIENLTASAVSTTEATLTWQTPGISTKSIIEYKKIGEEAVTVALDDTGEDHSYTLTELTPGTQYGVVVTAYDIEHDYNFGTAGITITTDTAEDTTDSLASYAKTVANTMRVNHGITSTDIDGSEEDVVFSRTDSTTNLTFIFSDTQNRLADYRLQLMLKAVDAANKIVFNKKKAFNDLGKAKFTVKQLETEKTYAVYTGVVDRNNDYVNKDGLSKRFNFTIQDAPQMFYPGSAVFNGNPEEIWVSSKSPSVTVEALDSSSAVVYSCVATMDSDHYGSCRPPYQLPGLGNYTFRLTDSRGGVNSIPTLISGPVANMNNPTLVTDSRHPDFLKRMFYGAHPTFTGVTGANHTVELHIPQISGAIYATVNKAQAGNPTTTWSYTHLLTDWPQGMATTVTIIDRNPDGSISKQFTYQTYRSFLPVVPAIVAPADNAISTTGPQVQLTGADFLEVLNSDGQRILLTDFVDRSRVVDLAQLGYTQPGDYTVSFRSFNRSRLLTRLVPFRFRIRPVRTTVVTNGNTNTNENDNTNTSVNTNTNSGTNTNTNTNDNTNTVEPTNDNTNTVATNDNTNSSNTNSATTSDTDHDGLSTELETGTYQTDPLDNDTDDDTLFDGDEVEFGSDPLLPDADNDGANDAIELIFQTDPHNADTDGDAVKDGTEVANRTSPTDTDTDDDGLDDNETATYGTLVLDADTDNDRLLDGDEVDRNCDPLKADTDGDGVDDLSEALANTSCTSADNIWENISGLEEYLQDQARAAYAATGLETASYPHLTSQVVPVDKEFKEKLNKRIRTATVVDYLAGAQTVVSKGEVTVVTRTEELSLLDWFNGQAGTQGDNTFVLVQGSVELPADVKDQPAYVVITFFSAPTVKIAKVDSNGQWTMSVPAELLTAGEHTAFAAVDVNGTQSDQIEVAKFVIKNERRLSNTAWLVIINVVIAIVALLTAAFIHLRHKRANQASSAL